MNIKVYDSTANDSLSKVRGIGRYLQSLKETLPKSTVFTSDLSEVPFESVFINPFINLIRPPLIIRRVARKQIGVIHDVIPLQFPEHFPIGLRGKLNVWQNKNSLKHYDIIVTDSETSKKNIIEKLQVISSKIQVIYPTIPKTFYSKSANDTRYTIPARNATHSVAGGPNTQYLIYVGDVTWNKNLVNLAKAIKLGTLPCVFVGKTFDKINELRITNYELTDPWSKELVEFAKLVDGDKRFAFPGFISDDSLKTLYKNAVANILVSHEEGFGFSFFEASSQKTPSILADTDIFHETARDTALFVDEDKPEDIAQAIKKISEDKTLRKNLGQKAFEHSRSLSDSTAQWGSLLRSLQTQQ